MLYILALNFQNLPGALAGVAQWIERGPASQRVAGSNPGLGRLPGLQARSPVGVTWGAAMH